MEENKLYEAAQAAFKCSKLQMTFVELFGKKAEIVQGERRFQTRRLGDTTYLIGERRDGDRRVTKC